LRRVLREWESREHGVEGERSLGNAGLREPFETEEGVEGEGV
jgi:hypothetical protein